MLLAAVIYKDTEFLTRSRKNDTDNSLLLNFGGSECNAEYSGGTPKPRQCAVYVPSACCDLLHLLLTTE